MTLPNPHASYLENMVATLLLHGNTRANLKVDSLAFHNRDKFTREDLLAEFEKQERAILSKPAPNAITDEIGEGK